MCQLAYNVRSAAEASGVSEHDIKSALQAKELVAHVIGERVVITATDMEVWLSSTPVWGDAR